MCMSLSITIHATLYIIVSEATCVRCPRDSSVYCDLYLISLIRVLGVGEAECRSEILFTVW